MRWQQIPLLVWICAVGCNADFHPIPSNADPTEADAVALLKPVASTISWHDDGRVRSISLVGNEISDTHVMALHDLKQLEELQLICPITDNTLREVATFPSVQALDVQFTSITDEGLRYLSASPSLELIVLTGTSITDKGLLYLAEVPTLKNIFAEKTAISEAGLIEFQDRRPDCRIQYDQGVIAAELADPPERSTLCVVPRTPVACYPFRPPGDPDRSPRQTRTRCQTRPSSSTSNTLHLISTHCTISKIS